MKVPYTDRFWAKVDKKGDNECWEWIRFVHKTLGYGIFYFENKTTTAHRIAWILTNGPIPEGLLVCHHCDNRKCCNPKHLFLGTQKDNMQDMVKKGRKALYTGETCYLARLTNKQVEEIRELYSTGNFTYKALAKRYGIHKCSVGRIIRYETRKKG